MKAPQEMSRRWRRLIGAGALLLLVLSSIGAADEAAVTVGVEGRLEAFLPAQDLKAMPTDRTSPITVHIASTRPHGTLVRYDLRYIGLVPGKYDLREHLLHDDGSAAKDLQPLPVTITGLLPIQHDGRLASISERRPAFFGRYKWMLGGVVLLWAALAVPLFRRGRRGTQMTGSSEDVRPLTLTERLRPLVTQASAGKLTATEKAQLERLLLIHWRERLGLESIDLADAVPRLREHREAGALLRALEDWLHRPPGAAKVDVEAVLAPYANPPVDAARAESTQ
jgi:hypothetical protein